jgi:hypothetical protein
VFRLTVTDNGGATGFDDVTVTVNPDPSVNRLPVVNAGADKAIILPVNTLVLTGTASDNDGTVASYLWTKQSGPAATLVGANSASLTVNDLVLGNYVFRLTVTDNKGETAFDEVTVTVTNPVVGQQVMSFTLIDAVTDLEIMTLSNGEVLNLATLPTRSLNIRANTSPILVGSVKLVLGGTQSKVVFETGAPYAMFGDTNGNYYAWTPALGNYTLTATPYTGAGGSGTAGTPLTITFSVVNQVVTAPLARKDVAATAAVLAESNAITAYPNPFQESIQLKIEAVEAEPYDIKVYDQVGKLQYQDKFTPGAPGADVHTLRLSQGTGRRAGVYLIVVENERRSIRKVIRVLKTQ